MCERDSLPEEETKAIPREIKNGNKIFKRKIRRLTFKTTKKRRCFVAEKSQASGLPLKNKVKKVYIGRNAFFQNQSGQFLIEESRNQNFDTVLIKVPQPENKSSNRNAGETILHKKSSFLRYLYSLNYVQNSTI
jgi:hypothetical protein